MNLFQIDFEIEEVLSALEPDENGECIEQEQLIERLSELGLEREEKLANLVGYVKNLTVDIASEKARADEMQKQVDAVKAHCKAMENKKKRILDVLMQKTDESTKTKYGTIVHKYSPSLKQDDVASIVRWLDKNGMVDLYTVSEPKIQANAVKKLVLEGADIAGCHIENSHSCYIVG